MTTHPWRVWRPKKHKAPKSSAHYLKLSTQNYFTRMDIERTHSETLKSAYAAVLRDWAESILDGDTFLTDTEVFHSARFAKSTARDQLYNRWFRYVDPLAGDDLDSVLARRVRTIANRKASLLRHGESRYDRTWIEDDDAWELGIR